LQTRLLLNQGREQPCRRPLNLAEAVLDRRGEQAGRDQDLGERDLVDFDPQHNLAGRLALAEPRRKRAASVIVVAPRAGSLPPAAPAQVHAPTT
jgi:hypothetical protein